MTVRPAQTVARSLVAVLLTAGGAACSSDPSPVASPSSDASRTATAGGPVSGETLPDLLLADLDGTPVPMRSLTTGMPVVLNYWYATCPPCREEMPALGMLAKEFTGRVIFVGINPQDDAATARSVAAERGTDYLQLLDSTQRSVDALGLTGFPTTVVVRADGSIAKSIRRAVSADELRAILDAELAA